METGTAWETLSEKIEEGVMKKIAIITARGGSKRIPGKNIRPFSGKPIMAYSIEAALESGIFDEVMVSTEDKRIAELAKQYGAKVPFFRRWWSFLIRRNAPW